MRRAVRTLRTHSSAGHLLVQQAHTSQEQLLTILASMQGQASEASCEAAAAARAIRLGATDEDPIVAGDSTA